MPPGSNHFGMQVGGAALALLAITGEAGVDQERVDLLLRIVKDSLIRNITEGFGAGGYYAEGDGTGSMATFITYLSALQAMKNVQGMDFVNTEFPNVPMTVLKWIYQTRFNTEALVARMAAARKSGTYPKPEEQRGPDEAHAGCLSAQRVGARRPERRRLFRHRLRRPHPTNSSRPCCGTTTTT